MTSSAPRARCNIVNTDAFERQCGAWSRAHHARFHISLDPAPRDSVSYWVQRLDAHLSPLHRERLTKLIGLIGADDHRIRYRDAYAALFPDSATDALAKTRADKAFSKFRDTIDG